MHRKSVLPLTVTRRHDDDDVNRNNAYCMPDVRVFHVSIIDGVWLSLNP